MDHHPSLYIWFTKAMYALYLCIIVKAQRDYTLMIPPTLKLETLKNDSPLYQHSAVE